MTQNGRNANYSCEHNKAGMQTLKKNMSHFWSQEMSAEESNFIKSALETHLVFIFILSLHCYRHRHHSCIWWIHLLLWIVMWPVYGYTGWPSLRCITLGHCGDTGGTLVSGIQGLGGDHPYCVGIVMLPNIGPGKIINYFQTSNLSRI